MTTFNRTSRTIALVTAVAGGIVLVGVGTTAAVASIRSANFTGQHGPHGAQITQTLSNSDLAGITSIDVESNASQFTLEFADVREASLTTEGEGRYDWELTVSGSALVVSQDMGLFNFCIGWCFGGDEHVTLTLPETLSNGKLDADLTVNAGSMTAEGSFGALDLELNAGSLTFDGAAHTLEGAVNAGRANMIVDSVSEAEIELSAGSGTAVFTGTAPRSISFEVSAGSFEATLPNTEYRVTSNIEVGKFTNELRQSPSARNLVEATVEAGRLTLTSQ